LGLGNVPTENIAEN
jgi:hypothetical protein